MKRSRRFHFPFLGVTLAAALIAALFLALERCTPETDEDVQSGEADRPAGVRPAARRPPGPGVRRIAVILDDIGHDLGLVEELAAIPEPVAFAILPHAPHAAAAARLLHRAGKEVLLHLPMEPRSYPAEDPGDGALFVAMDAAEIRLQLDRALAAVPYAAGVNNHMGSRFMENEAALDVVMAELAGRGLYFVDSRTTAGSRGREAAARAGVRFAARTVFIDHAPGYEAALSMLATPWQEANRTQMLLIGHPHADTLQALREARRIWREEGVRVIPVRDYTRPLPTGNAPKDSP
jgi:hypothetical protein